MAIGINNLRKKLKQRVKFAFSHATLTMRGELIVTKSGMANMSREEFDGLELHQLLTKLKKTVPGSKITIQEGVCDVTVSIFAYQAAVSEQVFDELQDIFEDIAAAVHGDDEADRQLRLDVTGKVSSSDGHRQVRFLNNGEHVAYRLLDVVDDSESPLSKLRQKVKHPQKKEAGD